MAIAFDSAGTRSVASGATTLGFKWNAGLGKWNLFAVGQEA